MTYSQKQTDKPGVLEESDWTAEEFAGRINETPIGKRKIIQKVVEVLIESEAFSEAYPKVYDQEKAEADAEYREEAFNYLIRMIDALFRKNGVSMDYRIKILGRIIMRYLSATNSQPERSEGSSGRSYTASQGVTPSAILSANACGVEQDSQIDPS